MRSVDLMLDSGAYSAWRKGVELDIHRYIDDLHRIKELLSSYVCLDLLPRFEGAVQGEKHLPAPHDVEKSARVSWENYETMRAAGLHPMPVFHQWESFEWLDRMVASGCDYIGISPDNGMRVPKRRQWLTQVYDRLCGNNDWPCVKTHGFGLTTIELMLEFPWFSVDSVAATLNSGHGKVMVPQLNQDGTYNYLASPIALRVSSKDVHTKEKRPEEIDATTHQHYIEYMKYVGVEYSDIEECYGARCEVSLRFFQGVEAEINKKARSYRAKREGLWAEPHGYDLSPIPDRRLTIIHGTSTSDKKRSLAFNRVDERDRLVSYYAVASTKTDIYECLDEFVTKGVIGDAPF